MVCIKELFSLFLLTHSLLFAHFLLYFAICVFITEKDFFSSTLHLSALQHTLITLLCFSAHVLNRIWSVWWTKCMKNYIFTLSIWFFSYAIKLYKCRKSFTLKSESILNLNLCASATPSAPYGITMLSCDGSSITLAWKSPKHCGGSKVNAYYIDKRDADCLVWKEVNLAPITERISTVSDISCTENLTIKIIVFSQHKHVSMYKEVFTTIICIQCSTSLVSSGGKPDRGNLLRVQGPGC